PFPSSPGKVGTAGAARYGEVPPRILHISSHWPWSDRSDRSCTVQTRKARKVTDFRHLPRALARGDSVPRTPLNPQPYPLSAANNALSSSPISLGLETVRAISSRKISPYRWRRRLTVIFRA